MLEKFNPVAIQMDMYNTIIDAKMDLAAKFGKPITMDTYGTVGDGSDGTNFSIDKLIENTIGKLSYWGSGLVIIFGLIMVIVGIYQLFKGLSSGGKSQVNWVVVVLLILIGGALAFTGGWSLVQKVAGGGAKTIEGLGGTT